MNKVKQALVFLGIIPAAMLFTACSSQDDSSSLSKNKGYSELVTKAEEGALDNPLFRGRAIYLRGEMNDYGVQSAYRLRKFEEDTYCTVAPLRSDWAPYRFKFADAEWSNGTNFGYAEPPAVLRQGSGRARLNPTSRFEELRYVPQEDGIYRFCVIYDGSVPYATVTLLEDGKLTTMDEVIKEEINRNFAIDDTVK
ncbi:MAG: hypothetical protein SOV16_04315 [Anaerobiospirillum succiniciproducens]|uniref:hypothetical protein n=1 Tax=Anaerobiospirillum succiniciproducens TaxID=13335 RepID=UPI002A74AE63|nr:hypothetical protein [Anaerobiospirillum succiniciproducens]MDY2798385.1 hypothetical protein [Anaerobiospirillum succiniciproducens]